MAVSMRITVFLDAILCSLAEHYQSALLETAVLQNIQNVLPDCMVLHPKRQKSSYSKSVLKYSITFNKLSSSFNLHLCVLRSS
jgi:hypothetical protein